MPEEGIAMASYLYLYRGLKFLRDLESRARSPQVTRDRAHLATLAPILYAKIPECMTS